MRLKAVHLVRTQPSRDNPVKPQFMQVRQRLAECERHLVRVQRTAEHDRHDIAGGAWRSASLYYLGQSVAMMLIELVGLHRLTGIEIEHTSASLT